ncbi:MAG: efflux RND transporter periplasmic adaptor subunit [Proteobacteria bacterium]|nr:efflux RND transporter periplasmic adaptor subunit [Pseudomonadota bacterium]
MRGRGVMALALLAWGCSGSEAEISPESSPVAEALRASVRVRIEPVRLGRAGESEELTGVVHAFHKARVTAEAPGRVVERLVDRGQRVAAGDLLFRLDASRLELALEQAEATLAARTTDLKHAQGQLARGERLAAESALSDQRMDDLRHAATAAQDAVALARVARDTASRQLADASIRAPFDASVETTPVDVGDYVAPGTPVATLVEASRVRLRAGVTASVAAHLSLGTKAQAHFDALSGEPVPAVLKSVGLVADPSAGTYDVEFWLDNPDAVLREGMVARIALPVAEADVARPLLPRGALLRREGRMSVFVVAGESGQMRARAREVRVGRNHGEWVEVLDGVAPGDAVVVEGHFALSDGAEVEVDRGDSAAADAP